MDFKKLEHHTWLTNPQARDTCNIIEVYLYHTAIQKFGVSTYVITLPFSLLIVSSYERHDQPNPPTQYVGLTLQVAVTSLTDQKSSLSDSVLSLCLRLSCCVSLSLALFCALHVFSPRCCCVNVKAFEFSDWLCLNHILEFGGGVTVCLIVACRIRQFQRRKWPKVRKPVSKSLWVWIIILLLVHRIQCHQATSLSESPLSLISFLLNASVWPAWYSISL